MPPSGNARTILKLSSPAVCLMFVTWRINDSANAMSSLVASS